MGGANVGGHVAPEQLLFLSMGPAAVITHSPRAESSDTWLPSQMTARLMSSWPVWVWGEGCVYVEGMGSQVIAVRPVQQLCRIPGKPAVDLLLPIADPPLLPVHRGAVPSDLEHGLRELRVLGVLAGLQGHWGEAGILTQELACGQRKCQGQL